MDEKSPFFIFTVEDEILSYFSQLLWEWYWQAWTKISCRTFDFVVVPCLQFDF